MSSIINYIVENYIPVWNTGDVCVKPSVDAVETISKMDAKSAAYAKIFQVGLSHISYEDLKDLYDNIENEK